MVKTVDIPADIGPTTTVGVDPSISAVAGSNEDLAQLKQASSTALINDSSQKRV